MVGVLFIWNVGTITIAKFLCKAKVYDIDDVRSLAGAHNKVGWLYVTMDKVMRVYKLDPG
jgi:hypothetical protein